LFAPAQNAYPIPQDRYAEKAFLRTPGGPCRVGAEDPRRVGVSPHMPLYIDPPSGRVGMTLAQAPTGGRRVLAGERPMARVARAFQKGETQGFMRILVDGDSKEILAASLLEHLTKRLNRLWIHMTARIRFNIPTGTRGPVMNGEALFR
jgi:hypothetical protein